MRKATAFSAGLMAGLTLNTAILAATVLATTLLTTSGAAAQQPPKLPIKAFAQLPQISSMEFSPDGENLMMVRPIKGRPHIVVQNAKTGKILTAIPPFEEFKVSWGTWASNDRIIASYKFDGMRGITPTVETRLVGVNKDGTESKYLIKPARIRGSRTFKPIPPDSGRCGASSSQRSRPHPAQH